MLALPLDGVPVAAMITDALGAPPDLILVRKIDAPHQPELAIGAIADDVTPLGELNAASIELLGVLGSYIAADKARQWRQRGAAKIVVVIPVASQRALGELQAVADEIICPETRHDFLGVSGHYGDFAQFADEEVRAYLASQPLPVERQGAQP